MEKAKTFLLLASSLTLLSCNQNSDDSDSLPKGSEVAKEEAEIHYAKALEAMSKAVSFGVKLSGNASISEEYAYSSITPETSLESSSFSKIELNDIDANLAMALSDDDLSASMGVSAGYSFEHNGTSPIYSGESDVSREGNLSLKAYYADRTLYADGTGMSELLSCFYNSSATPNLKVKTTLDTPSIDWSDLTNKLDKLSEEAAQSEYLQGKNGVYSYVYTLDPAADSDSSSPGKWSGEAKAWLSFTEEGFTEIGVSGKMNYTSSFDLLNSENSYGTSSKTDIALSANLKANFSYGDSVKVEEVSDPENYVEESIELD